MVEDYVDKMPFAFTGTLKKFVVILEPEKPSPEERKALWDAEAKAYMGFTETLSDCVGLPKDTPLNKTADCVLSLVPAEDGSARSQDNGAHLNN